MSFFKKLFGGGATTESDAPAKEGEAVEYKGFSISPAPFKSDGQFQTCAMIRKEIDGTLREHRLIRADRFSSASDAADQAMRKARQVIDEQGERLFG